MDLSISEVATLLGKSARTVRAQVAGGRIPATKRHGRWRIPSRTLPLNELQRKDLQAKAEAIRRAVDEVLPSRAAVDRSQRHRSIADLGAFRLAADLLTEIKSCPEDGLETDSLRRVERLIQKASFSIATAVHQYERQIKLASLNQARGDLARAAALLLLAGGIPPRDPYAGWIATLETEVLPAVAGFARWADKLAKGR